MLAVIYLEKSETVFLMLLKVFGLLKIINLKMLNFGRIQSVCSRVQQIPASLLIIFGSSVV